MTKTDWKKEKAIELLFDTNLRWQFIHTKILQRFPIHIKEKEEYEQVLDQTVDCLASIRADQKAEDYRKTRAGLKKIGETAEGTFPVGFWDEVWQLLDKGGNK